MSADLGQVADLRQYPATTDLCWTPAKYLLAAQLSDGGDMSLAADLCSAIMRDDRAGGVLEQRTLGMLSLPSAVERADGELAPPIPQWPTGFPEAEQQRLLTWGIVLGFCFGRARMVAAPTGWQLDVRAWEPKWFSWRDSEQRWYVQARRFDGAGQVSAVYEPVTAADGWFCYAPFGASEPWRYGLWHRLAVPYLAKIFALDDRARESEVTSVLVGETTGLSDEQQASFLADLQGLARDSRVVLPEGCKLAVVSRSDATRASIWAESIAWADQATTIAIANQVTTTEGSEGFSSGRVQKNVLSATLRAQEETFSTTIGERVITPWLRVATGYDGPTVYQRWQVQDAEDLIAQGYAVAQFAGALDAANAALAQDGVRVDVRALLERTGLPLVAIPGRLPS